MSEVRAIRVLCLVGMAVALAGCSRQAVVADSPAAGPSGTALLTADLNRLKAKQTDYESANGQYASTIGELGFTPSDGVQVSVIQGDERGFSAIASDGTNECAIYTGSVRSPRGYVNGPNAVFCRA